MTERPEPILYSFRRCPYAMRARLALTVSGTRYALREVRLRDKPTAMLEASPKGTVPVLVLPDGQVIDESLDIMLWALTRCDPEGWLERHDSALIATNDGPFKQDLDRFKYPGRHGVDPLAHRRRGMAFLDELESRLSARDQLGGSARGFTDAAIMPIVRQFSAVDPEWFDRLPLQRLRRWLNGHLESDLFQTVMLRVAPWSPANSPIFVPPAGD